MTARGVRPQHEEVVLREAPYDHPDVVALTEADGVTTMRTVITYASKEMRDGAYASGMAEGIDAGFDRLDVRWPAEVR